MTFMKLASFLSKERGGLLKTWKCDEGVVVRVLE